MPEKYQPIEPFCFDDDIWNLRHFYPNTYHKTINFANVKPHWYQLKVKRYILYLLQTKTYKSSSNIIAHLANLKHFGQTIEKCQLSQITDIERPTILEYLNKMFDVKPRTVRGKIFTIKSLLEWYEIETGQLFRYRDIPKITDSPPNWLDEKVRSAIKEHLPKIPAPIARQYLIQEYTAARPIDVRLMMFNCLVEEQGSWYIKFYQNKVDRWHMIPGSNHIRRIIEEQQQWIRKSMGEDYQYLFCHFQGIKRRSYPQFPQMKALPYPHSGSVRNQMVKIIRLLIEHEGILDANGRVPHFTGKITRASRLQEIRVKYGLKAAQLYADHKRSEVTLEHYAPPTREQVSRADLPFQKLLMNPENKFLPWQSLPESLLKNPKSHELDLEIAPRLVVYGHCTLDPKTPCPVNLYPKCYGCSSFRPSTGKLPLYERQYQGEQQRLTDAEKAGAELASEEAKATIEAMDKWLPELRRLADV